MALSDKKCVPCEGGALPLTIPQAEALMKELQGWTLAKDGREIEKKFTFSNFAEALAFTNKVGAIAEEENHHPEIELGW